MITVELVKCGCLSDLACSSTQVLMFYGYSMPVMVKIYRTFLQFSIYVGAVGILKCLIRMKNIFTVTKSDHRIEQDTI